MSHKEYIEILRARLNTIREELDVLHKQASSIMREIEAKQQVAQHLTELLAAEGYHVDDEELASLSQTRPVDLAFEYLEQQDGHSPIHYKELTTVLISKGSLIAGKDPAANLLTQISRDSRFVRVGPGKYGLAKWKIKPRISARPRRKKRKR
jgi:hypothetical protein